MTGTVTGVDGHAPNVLDGIGPRADQLRADADALDQQAEKVAAQLARKDTAVERAQERVAKANAALGQAAEARDQVHAELERLRREAGELRAAATTAVHALVPAAEQRITEQRRAEAASSDRFSPWWRQWVTVHVAGDAFTGQLYAIDPARKTITVHGVDGEVVIRFGAVLEIRAHDPLTTQPLPGPADGAVAALIGADPASADPTTTFRDVQAPADDAAIPASPTATNGDTR